MRYSGLKSEKEKKVHLHRLDKDISSYPGMLCQSENLSARAGRAGGGVTPTEGESKNIHGVLLCISGSQSSTRKQCTVEEFIGYTVHTHADVIRVYMHT